MNKDALDSFQDIFDIDFVWDNRNLTKLRKIGNVSDFVFL